MNGGFFSRIDVEVFRCTNMPVRRQGMRADNKKLNVVGVEFG